MSKIIQIQMEKIQGLIKIVAQSTIIIKKFKMNQITQKNQLVIL